MSAPNDDSYMACWPATTPLSPAHATLWISRAKVKPPPARPKSWLLWIALRNLCSCFPFLTTKHPPSYLGCWTKSSFVSSRCARNHPLGRHSRIPIRIVRGHHGFHRDDADNHLWTECPKQRRDRELVALLESCDEVSVSVGLSKLALLRSTHMFCLQHSPS